MKFTTVVNFGVETYILLLFVPRLVLLVHARLSPCSCGINKYALKGATSRVGECDVDDVDCHQRVCSYWLVWTKLFHFR